MNAKVVALPNNGLAITHEGLAAHLREQADWLEEPDASEVVSITVIYENADGTLHRNVCGARRSCMEQIGLLEIAKRDLLNEIV